MPKSAAVISVIDIGSNSFQQIIAKVHGDLRIQYLDRQKTTLRLLDFSSADKCIPQQKIDEAIKVLRRYKENAIAFKAPIVATASSATREAANGTDFLHAVKAQCNIEVELISGSREASLVFKAVKAHYPKMYNHACVMDIGGGSFEVVYGTGSEIVYRKSLPLGVVRLSQMFFHNYNTEHDTLEAMRKYISSVLWEALEPLTVPKETVFIGTSGAFRIIANYINRNKKGKKDRFSIQHLQELAEEVLPLSTPAKRKKILSNEPDRADILPASIILLQEIARQLNAPKFIYAPYGLREGILLEKAGLLPK